MLRTTSNTLIHKSFYVNIGERKDVLLNDPIEGDINFTFIIEHSFESQTIINVISSHCAEIVISTNCMQKVCPVNPIRLGTYKGLYELYLNYEISPADNFGKLGVIVTFIAKNS